MDTFNHYKMSDKAKIKLLAQALEAAKSHLEYCGYGDSWERECAQGSGLPERIEDALIKTKAAK